MIHLRIPMGAAYGPEDETACGVEVCRLGRVGEATGERDAVTCEDCKAAMRGEGPGRDEALRQVLQRGAANLRAATGAGEASGAWARVRRGGEAERRLREAFPGAEERDADGVPGCVEIRIGGEDDPREIKPDDPLPGNERVYPPGMWDALMPADGPATLPPAPSVPGATVEPPFVTRAKEKIASAGAAPPGGYGESWVQPLDNRTGRIHYLDVLKERAHRVPGPGLVDPGPAVPPMTGRLAPDPDDAGPCGCGRPLTVARDGAGKRIGVTHTPEDEDHHLRFWSGRGPDQIAAAMDLVHRGPPGEARPLGVAPLPVPAPMPLPHVIGPARTATADETECAACSNRATGRCRGCGEPLCEDHTGVGGRCRSCE